MSDPARIGNWTGGYGQIGVCSRTWVSYWTCCVLCLAFAIGCASHADRIARPRNLFYEGEFTACREQLEKLHRSHRGDRDVANLDLAMVDLLDGKIEQAERRLKEARDRFDYLEKESLSEKTVSMWTDDTARSYAGEDYERDRKSTRLNSSHEWISRMPSSA